MEKREKVIKEITNMLENNSRYNSNGTKMFLESENFEEAAEDIFMSYHSVYKDKRFYAACKAMQGLLTSPGDGEYFDIQSRIMEDYLVRDAYKIADEMLKRENQ